MNGYVERHEGGYRIAGTRVSLDSVVYAYRDGESPESIVQSFPVLDLEKVHGALAYYLAHREDVDAYLARASAEYDEARRADRAADPAFYARLQSARRSVARK